jgi:hypothetical protein
MGSVELIPVYFVVCLECLSWDHFQHGEVFSFFEIKVERYCLLATSECPFFLYNEVF